MTCLHRFPYTGINFMVNDCCWRLRPDLKTSVIGSLIPGAIAGCAGTMVCYPLEVVRTRCMTQRSQVGLLKTSISILRTEGFCSMYRGSDMALAVSIPSLVQRLRPMGQNFRQVRWDKSTMTFVVSMVFGWT